LKRVAPASLIAILGTSLGGIKELHEKKLINYKLAAILESASILGAILGVILYSYVSSKQLTLILAVTLIASGALIMARGVGLEVSIDLEKVKIKGALSSRGSLTQLIRVASSWTASLLAGLLSAALGIGGGLVKVPVLVLIAGLDVKEAIATSKFMVGITALSGVLGHAIGENLDYILALLLLAGTYGGASLSSKILIRLKSRSLAFIASLYYFIMGSLLITKSL